MRSRTGATLGLGTAPLGSLVADVSPQAASDTVEAAWGLGIRFFDTAPLYGSGLAEERLGRALAGRPREEYTVSTKVGRVLRSGKARPEFRGAPPLESVFDFSTEGIRRSLAGSQSPSSSAATPTSSSSPAAIRCSTAPPATSYCRSALRLLDHPVPEELWSELLGHEPHGPWRA